MDPFYPFERQKSAEKIESKNLPAKCMTSNILQIILQVLRIFHIGFSMDVWWLPTKKGPISPSDCFTLTHSYSSGKPGNSWRVHSPRVSRVKSTDSWNSSLRKLAGNHPNLTRKPPWGYCITYVESNYVVDYGTWPKVSYCQVVEGRGSNIARTVSCWDYMNKLHCLKEFSKKSYLQSIEVTQDF